MSDNELAIAYIQRLTKEGFWGNITLKLQRGQIIHITSEEGFKPSETVPGCRRNYERTSNQ